MFLKLFKEKEAINLFQHGKFKHRFKAMLKYISVNLSFVG